MKRRQALYLRERKKKCFPDPFPVHALKRQERPTTKVIDEEIRRMDERKNGFFRASMGELGSFVQEEYKRFVPKHPVSGALVSMCGALGNLVDVHPEDMDHSSTPWSVSSWKPMPPIAPEKAPSTDDPVAMARHIKELAYFLRADAVGICLLPPYAVYSHGKHDGSEVKLDHRFAIAILVDQDWKTAEATNGNDWISNAMSFVAYTTSAFIACMIADYIRRLGFPARAHHAMNYQLMVPPILLWAGLGEMCRIGDIVLHPFLGPRFKAAIVTTDLPMEIDRPIDFGLQDFCSKCKKCARECPAQAISHGDKVMYNGYEKWQNDVDKCTSFRVGNQNGAGCGRCIKVCPWNKPFTPIHRAINWSMRHVPFLRRFGVWGDDLLGFGKPKAGGKWWLDLEEKDGRLQIPD